jgi:hypothetical protein
MADLGNKHECSSCGTKFYDLGRSQLVCPSCGGDQEELAKGAAEEDPPGAKPTGTKTKKTRKTKKTEKDEPSEDQEEAPSSSDK